MFLYADDALAPGAFIDGWVVDRLVARGAMANVYQAVGTGGVRVALKVLHTAHLHDAVALQRFAREREFMQLVVHPAVVCCLGSGELANGLPFLVLEWLEGTTLAERVTQRGPMPLAEVTQVLEQLCSAVQATHEAGLVHRDLKAENVYCVAEGGLKLLDFGIARQTGNSQLPLTSTGHLLGTPIALAPEQIRGSATSAATDIYSLGVLIYVALTGRPPFEAQSLIDLEALHFKATPPALGSRVQVPPALEAVVARCLEKEPAARYTSAAALWLAWQEALKDTGHLGLAVGVMGRFEAAPDSSEATFQALEAIEQRATLAFVSAGLALVSEGAVLLGCRIAEGDPVATLARWRAFAINLKGVLATPDVSVSLWVRVSPVKVEAGKIAQGEVLRPLSWPPSSAV